MLNPVILRMAARKSLKGHWQTALIAAFTAGIFVTLFQIAFTLRLNEALSGLYALFNGNMTLAEFTAGFFAINWMMPLIALGLMIIVSPFLQLGMIRYYLLRLKNAPSSAFSVIFSAAPFFFKALGLNLFINMKIGLWGLLAAVPAVALTFIIPMDASAAAFILYVPSAVLMLAAYYRYILAPYALAEDTATGIREAVRMSSKKMKGNKRQCLIIHIGFAGWYFLLVLLSSFLPDIVGAVLSLAVTLFAELMLSVYIGSTFAAYYLYRCHEVKPVENAENS